MDDCDGGWGLGWFLPALLVGRLIADAFERPLQAMPPVGQRPAPPPAPAAQAVTRPVCRNCRGALSGDFVYCPHCGQRLAPPACRYCGRDLKPDMTQCAHCGGPTRA